jgi:hypothetical protein
MLLKRRWKAGSVVIAAFLIASIASAPRRQSATDVPILSGAEIDPAVLALIQRSCQDCHSDRTHYPWYSYVAPVSWLVTGDVERGRERLNLSHWSEYPLVRKERSLSEIANQVKDRDMPLAQYTWIHPGARLSDAEVGAIFRWTQAERARLIASSAAPR